MNPWLVPLDEETKKFWDGITVCRGSYQEYVNGNERGSYIKKLKQEFNVLLKRYRDGLFFIFDDPELTEEMRGERKEKYYSEFKKIRKRMGRILSDLERYGVVYDDRVLEVGFVEVQEDKNS